MFTGSTATGRTVAEQAGDAAHRRIDGARRQERDDRAARTPTSGAPSRAPSARCSRTPASSASRSSGCSCTSRSRTSSPRSWSSACSGMKLGTTLDYGADMGSLISAVAARDGDDARRRRGVEGRRGAGRRHARGRTSARTSTSRRCSAASTDGMTLFRDETFGPVVAISRFSSEDEVVARANDSDYGLNFSRLDARHAARPRDRHAPAGRHGQRQRGLHRRVGVGGRADGRHEGIRARPPPRRARHPEVHRGADHRRAAAAADRTAAAACATALWTRVMTVSLRLLRRTPGVR